MLGTFMKRVRCIVVLPLKAVLDTTKQASIFDAVISEFGTISSVLLPRQGVNLVVLASETHNNFWFLEHNVS